MKKNKYFYNKGFTLVELIVVVMVIAILATIGLTSYRKVIDRAKRSEAMQTLNVMYKAWRSYYDVNLTPPSRDGSDIDVDLPSVQGGASPSTQYWFYYFGNWNLSGETEVVFAASEDVETSLNPDVKVIGMTEEGEFTYTGFDFE